jgi:hypothetical protein
MKRVLQILAVLSLVFCGLVAVQRFLGDLSDEAYKSRFLWASIGWFVFQTAAFAVGKKNASQP